MSGDIGPGDPVVCVDALLHLPCDGWAPQRGRYYRVADVFDGEDTIGGLSGIGVDLVEDPTPDPERAWPIEMFRKLNDGEDDAELIARIKNCSPVREGVPS
jgi:hypothetical protein